MSRKVQEEDLVGVEKWGIYYPRREIVGEGSQLDKDWIGLKAGQIKTKARSAKNPEIQACSSNQTRFKGHASTRSISC